MAIQQRYSTFRDLGHLFTEAANQSSDTPKTDTFQQKLADAIRQAEIHNPWFTKDNIKFRLKSLANALISTSDPASKLEEIENHTRKIGLIPEGRIPLQGFETLFSILISGNSALVKPAKEDEVLMKFVIDFLKQTTVFSDKDLQIAERFKDTDAVIISTEEKMLPFYEKYFGHLPHLLRTRKWSAALLESSVSEEELRELADGVFRFFGLGDANIHKLYLPEDFDTDRLFEAFFHWDSVMENNRYMNNYEYHRTLFLLEDLSFLDNNFLILREMNDLKSPTGVLHFETYTDLKEVQSDLEKQKSSLDKIYGKGFSHPLGSAFQSDFSISGQEAEVWDFLKNLD